MRRYELVTLFPSMEEVDSTASAVEKITALVTGNGGSVTSVHEWGRRRLAYKIDDIPDANYILCKIQMEPEDTAGLEAGIRLDREIMRHLLVYDEGGVGPVIEPVAPEGEEDG